LLNNFEISAPAKVKAIEKAELHFAFKFPTDYKEFLMFSNGLEGSTKDSYIVIWSIEELIELNEAYKVRDFISNLIIFGSDGAEDAYGFDISGGKCKIVKLPFIGMGYISNEMIGDTFDNFLSSKIEQNKTIFNRLFG
jgi:hypothetical protein